ncbi:MAG: hypothetical protein AB7T49_19550 [Oligoflexales bacterium]
MLTNFRKAIPFVISAFVGFEGAALADGGTSSGGDQPFHFVLNCYDAAGTAKVTVEDSSLGHGSVTAENLKTKETKTVAVSSHLFRYLGDSDAGEFFVRYIPSNTDISTLLDVQLEETTKGNPKQYKASWFGYTGLPLPDVYELQCEGEF